LKNSPGVIFGVDSGYFQGELIWIAFYYQLKNY